MHVNTFVRPEGSTQNNVSQHVYGNVCLFTRTLHRASQDGSTKCVFSREYVKAAVTPYHSAGDACSRSSSLHLCGRSGT